MAAPVAAIIQLPDDAGNAGKKIRTQSRVVGANTVHEHFFIEGRACQVLSVYRLAVTQQTVLAAAQNGTTAGFLFGHMPSTAGAKSLRIRRASFTSQHSTALATPTAPRLVIRRYTSAGGLSGAALAPAKVKTSWANPAAIFSLVNTGNTVVHVGDPFGAAALAGALTAVGAYEPCYKDLVDPAADEDEWMEFAAGEGFVVYQDTAGTTSDTRKFSLQFLFDEIDTA
jgi:hypothetical protein